MIKSNEMQIGKAGEHLTCSDLIMKGLIAFPSEQGLPYDVLIDTGEKILRCQVKTTEKPRVIPQRSKESFAYIFNIKRHGKGNAKRYTSKEVDVFALVELQNRTVAYLKPEDTPDTINLRVDAFRGMYYDEKGIRDFCSVMELKAHGLSQTEAAKRIDLAIATVNRMWQDDYAPHKTSAKYFSDLYKEREWFDGI